MADGLKFQWDAANVSHLARHKVTPLEAEQALTNDPNHLNYDVWEGEERWTSVGHTETIRVLVVVWTTREQDTVRVITAWQAHKTARKNYLREKGFGI